MELVPSEPLLSILIEPITLVDAERLERGIAELATDDPSFRSKSDPDTGQTTLTSNDELHLDSLVRILLDKYKVESRIGAPSVVYRRSGKQLLEPIMKIEVVAPIEKLELVKGDIRSRRGKVRTKSSVGASGEISAFVPLANMSGYLSSILSMTSSRGTFSMCFDHFAPCPNDNDPDGQPPFVQAKRA
ncbi:MAG: hypothetical protein AAFR34_02940 [Pseudomonadota bacterium]